MKNLLRPALMLITILLFGLLLAACGDPTPTTTMATMAATTAVPTTAAGAATTAAGQGAATTAPAGATTASGAATTAAAAATADPNLKTETVKVVHVPGLFFAPLYVAIDKGFFKEQGIEVQLDKAGAGSEVMAFLAQGQIDVGAVGLSAATFNALNKGFDFKIIASAGIGPDKNSPTKFEVRKALVDGGQVKKISDLKGKKIAVAGGIGSAGAYLAVRALQTDGLTAKDVEFVNLANPDMVQALKNGAVDAALIGTPFSTQAIEQGVGSILIDDWLPGYSTTTYMYSGKFVKERAAVGQRFAIALLKGFRAIAGNNYLSDENVKIYAKYTGSNEATIKATPPLVYDLDMGLTKDSIKDQEKIHRESGWTDYKQAVDVEKIFDTSFTDAALKVLRPTK